jgi:hypothetical protein
VPSSRDSGAFFSFLLEERGLGGFKPQTPRKKRGGESCFWSVFVAPRPTGPSKKSAVEKKRPKKAKRES